MFVQLFRHAGAAGQVFSLTRNGDYQNRGLGWSGLVGPFTTLAVVPTNQHAIPLIVEARTKDRQTVSVSGTVQITLSAEQALKAFDFTVDIRNGGAKGQWQRDLQTNVTSALRSAVMQLVATKNVDEVVVAHRQIEESITAHAASLTQFGARIVSCSIENVEPEDDEVSEAIGAEEREKMLTEADAARHARQMNALENSRKVKETEAATNLLLEKERAKLVAEQGNNEIARAKTDAEATRIRIEPISSLPPNVGLVTALKAAADSGRVTNITLTSDLLAALNPDGRK